MTPNVTLPLIVRAARRQSLERAPVWIMRQAGRYLPEYRAIRERTSFLDLCKTPELAATVSLQPVTRLGVDAAIIFSDILLPLEAMGLALEFTEKGPYLPEPVRSLEAIRKLGLPDPDLDLPFVGEAIRLLKAEVAGRVPIIGFAGAPFTLAAYAVDGQGSKEFVRTKQLMVQEPAGFALLLDKMVETVSLALAAQVRAGADLVQLFDSWGGILGEADYRNFALPATAKIVNKLQSEGVPIILYLGGGPHLVDAMVETGVDVLSLDWRVNLGAVMDRWGDRVAVQGNLDPTRLLAAPEQIRRDVDQIAEAVGGRPGHIWNLGHGILPQTEVAHAQAFVMAAKAARSPTKTPLAASSFGNA